jgi:hypothetical protein
MSVDLPSIGKIEYEKLTIFVFFVQPTLFNFSLFVSQYYELEKEHKKISDRCQEIEAQLKDEKKSTASNSKVST